jgi:hypothetical protein
MQNITGLEKYHEHIPAHDFNGLQLRIRTTTARLPM